MSRLNINAILLAIILLYVIVGFTIYFNNPGLDKAWSIKQKDKAMVKLGVHSPQFMLEKNYTNKTAAVQRFGIIYPATTENHTITTTFKINNTVFHQVNESQFEKAPEFTHISGYINTPNNSPLTLSSLKGKVVLVYIWTYTCINSIRPMPYIHDWNQKYSDKGLVIVGLHAPEFTFEKNYTDVKAAVQRFGITYPVILDSDHGTWNAYGNQYWPRFYLIDTQGYITDCLRFPD